MIKTAAIFNPAEFQGRGRNKSYFEGWYYKVINSAETKAYAFIPGIAMDTAGNKQAFVQVLDGKKHAAHYFTFDSNSFVAKSGKFEIAVGENQFSIGSINLHLPGIQGCLTFKNQIPWPSHWYSPGIMGPFTFVPFMECYHGILSMDHTVFGQLQIDGEIIDFDNGRGYIEKDWGRSFPNAYVWMQSNHFSTPGVSIKVSVAKIPWMGKSFVGFIAGVWLHDRLIRFTTYNNAFLRKLTIDKNKIELVLENKNYQLYVVAVRDTATSLASPIRGLMEGRIEESMSSIIEVSITDKKTGHEIFRDSGRNAGLEVAGSINEIVRP